jgi:hypothetical protein
MDRIEKTYQSMDDIIACHGKPRPKKFGGGVWNAREEFIIYKEQVGNLYTKLQWIIIEQYFRKKFIEKHGK